MVRWHGVFPAVTTQFHADESVDLAGTVAQIEALLAAGVHGLVMLGTVGENCSLEPDEKLAVLQAAAKAVNGRVPVLTGVAEYTTRGGSRFAQAAARAGVDGLMVLPAMVYKGDDREQQVHFRTIAAATDLPILLYNNPVSYGVDLRPETIAKLADVSTIVAVKESSEDPRRITDLANHCGDRFLLFAGVDDLVLESYALGAVGWVSGLVNAFPKENRLLWDLLEAGRWTEARQVYRWYTPLLHLDTHPKLVQYIKLAASAMGLGSEVTRPPRLAIEGAEREAILALVRRADATRPKVTVNG